MRKGHLEKLNKKKLDFYNQEYLTLYFVFLLSDPLFFVECCNKNITNPNLLYYIFDFLQNTIYITV